MSRDVREVDRPYSTNGGRVSGLPWPRVLVRFFLLTVPAQLIGTAIGGALLDASGLLRDSPQLANLISVVAGVVAGIATGLLVSPAPERRSTYVVVNAVVGVGSMLVLLIIARLRLPAGTPSSDWSTYVLGAVLVGGIQTLLAWGLWITRHRL